MSCFTDIENKPDDWLVLDPLIVQKPIPKTGCDINLLVLNYLSEFKTEDLKKKVRDNLGLFVDNILSKNSNNPISNKAVYEAFNKYVGLRSIKWTTNSDMNNYIDVGMYVILGEKTNAKDNLPILNNGTINARLIVTTTESDNNIVITLILNLNNNAGGEGNIYIRSCQNGTWKPWGKLQTNVEVGQITPDDMSNLIDNGIYSGVCVDGTTVETFVLIVINNYLAASQAGFGGYISQLKYAIDLNRGNTVKTRTRDAYGIWSDWSEIGGSDYELPAATVDTLGGVKLGKANNDMHAPLINIGTQGSGVGIAIDSSVLKNSSCGLSVRLGTTAYPRTIIPCVSGDNQSSDGSRWGTPSVGIPYNTEQFCLKANGLNLVDGIAFGATKVTWDANSSINDYTTAGVYDITGTRGSIYDYLPITNLGENATIAAKLIVTVTPEGATTYRHSVGQTLILSNSEGKETKVYTRNGNRTIPTGGSEYVVTWGDWKCLQGMVESYINTNSVSITTTGVTLGTGTTDNVKAGLNSMTENGMYSGIYTDDLSLQAPTFVETFVLVVINDYAVSSQAGTPRRISQLKYATDTLTGQCTVKKRVGTGSDSISWSDWEEIGGGGSSEVDISDAVKAYGLPTLIEQGLAKEGVTYKVVCPVSAVPQIDNNGKISTHIDNHRYNADDIATMLIKVQQAPNGIPSVFIDCTIVSPIESYSYKYVISIINDSDEIVKVSADMTEL